MTRGLVLVALLVCPLGAQAASKAACAKQTEMVQAVVDARKAGQSQGDAVTGILGDMARPSATMRTAVTQAAAWVYSVEPAQLDAVPAAYQSACEAQ